MLHHGFGFAPVLSMQEAAQHPHNVTRGFYQRSENGKLDVAVAPRFMSLQSRGSSETSHESADRIRTSET